MQENEMKQTQANEAEVNEAKGSKVGALLWGILFFLITLLGCATNWCVKTWAHLTMEELIYTLTAPLEGTGSQMVNGFIVSCLVPAAVLTLVLFIVIALLNRKFGKTFGLRLVGMIGALLFLGVSFAVAWSKLDVNTYIQNQTATDVGFIAEHYVDPLEVGIEFPEEKRNLIFIYLESMETTYTDKENGGGFEVNCIPELTALAQQYEDFSGSNEHLNGGYVLTGTSWTMAALFAQTSGIPLQVSIGGNAMGTQEHFFPSMINLGDILEMGGYTQAFMIGSEAEFGGRKLFFEDHGAYQIKDYHYAIDQELIPGNYKVSWGFEDKKLFEFAKQELLQMAAGDQPFNLTLLTVDTHFEDGYLCEDCQNHFEGDQYANVMACSSRKVAEFIAWIQEQEFYENTTIVLSGDHLTMDSDFCSNVSGGYARKTYTCVINPGCENQQEGQKREYTTMDIFPTTLAALNVRIEGDRLGLGTNLFSARPTLIEEYGLPKVRQEVAKKSAFLEAMAELDETTDAYLKSMGTYPAAVVQVEKTEGDKLRLSVSDVTNLDDLAGVELDIWDMENPKAVKTIRLKERENGYETELSIKKYADKTLGSAVYVVDGNGRRYQIGELPGDLGLYTNNFYEYLTALANKDYAVFLAVRDEAATSLSAWGRQKLRELGFQIDLGGQVRSSYYAVLDHGKVLCENISQERIGENGMLLDGKTSYSIMSSGFLAGSDCSIRIDGQEYAIGKRGINIVVYDTKTGRLIDSVCFDTYSGKYVTRTSGTVEIEFLKGNGVSYKQDRSLQELGFSDYLKQVNQKESYVLFLVIKDEGTNGLTEEMKQALRALGITTDLTDQYRRSYYAIVDGDHVIEQLGDGVLETMGMLENGIFYEVRSQGYDVNGSRCSIKLEGVEYAVNTRGMNIVVYDTKQGCIVDSVVFDTHEAAAATRKN